MNSNRSVRETVAQALSLPSRRSCRLKTASRQIFAPFLAPALALVAPTWLLAQSATVNLSDAAFIAKGAAQYAKTCAVGYCHGAEGLPARGPGLRGRRWDTQKLYSQIHDGIPNTTMPAWKNILTESEIWQVVAYVISLGDAGITTVSAGMATTSAPRELTANAQRGRNLFFDLTNEKRCSICHQLGAGGTPIGPNLATVAGKPADQLLRDIIEPAASIAKGFEQTVVLTKSGETIAGIKKDDEARLIRIYDMGALPPPLRTIYRDEIRSETNRGKSSMPAGYGETYSADELTALLEFLRTSVD